jgi:hypothetical protein
MEETGKQDKRFKYWNEELRLAKKRDERWQKQADACVKLYEGEKETENSFNILYANTETLLPSCYNQLPRAVVERRYRDKDPLAKASAETLQRTLQYLMDTNSTEHCSFHSVVQQAVLGALVPGRGVTRFHYEPKFETVQEPVGDAEEDDGSAGETEGAPDTPGEALFPDPASREKVVSETIYAEDWDYAKFRMGFATSWSKVPWVAYEHAMTKEDFEANFGSAKGVEFATRKKDNDTDDSEDEENNEGSDPTVCVWEIWHKASRKIIFLCEKADEPIIEEREDPYELRGFYSCCPPLQFLLKKSGMVPTPLYKLYEQQAKELNRLTMRINRVLNAMKVRGFYDGSIQGLKELLSADDNTLIAAKNVAALQDGKNLQNSIWMMPLNELIVVLQQLMMGREQCKNTIYEITGISDIMRGDTNASETFGAQNLKSQWGTLRLQRIQTLVQEYARQALQIMADLASGFFSIETFAGMTNLDFATPEEVQQAQQMMQQLQVMQMQMQQQAAMQPPSPGGPPAQPPQLPPQIMQAAQEAQATLAKPKWEEILALLKDDTLRCYRIDIETNSTINPKNKEQQQVMTEAMMALGQMFQNFGPAVQSGGLPMPALKAMTLAVMRRFEFGKEVEDALETMPDKLPQAQGPDPKQVEAMQKEMQQKEAEVQKQLQEVEKGKQDLVVQQEKIRAVIDQAREKMKLEGERQEAAVEMKIEKALMQIEQLLGQNSLEVDNKLHEVTMQQEAGARPEQRGGNEKQKKVQGDARLAAVIQEVVKGTQLTQQSIAGIVEQIAVMARPKKIIVGRDSDGNMTDITAH